MLLTIETYNHSFYRVMILINAEGTGNARKILCEAKASLRASLSTFPALQTVTTNMAKSYPKALKASGSLPYSSLKSSMNCTTKGSLSNEE